MRYHVEAFEFESDDEMDPFVDKDGDQVYYRYGGIMIFIPEGVKVTPIRPKGGLYAPRDTPMTDAGFEVTRWHESEIKSYDRYNGDGSFDRNHIRVTVDYLED
jgi:hypothetical protein